MLRFLTTSAFLAVVHSCSNFGVSKGASTDGSVHFAYAADAGELYGTIGHYPAGNHSAGAMRDVWDWDSGVYLGQIKEAPYTYNVIGNINEFQLAIGETTFGGVMKAQKAPLDYGNLIWVTLQRCKTAREAIKMMGELVAEYGYASEGETFTIGDTEELWVMELIGKGPNEKGAVWVAQRVPDGSVIAHANQARTRTFPRNDPDRCIYAPDVVSFAVSQGLYPKDAPEEDFSFSDVFDPVTFIGARLGEMRVWDMYSHVSNQADFRDQYRDYVQGRNLTNRMPLFVQPKQKLSINDTMWLMRTHFEGTSNDARMDVGGGAYNSPYRTRPLTWTNQGLHYVNERTVGTQQTGWHFLAQMRGHLPDPVGGVIWFGVDDTSMSVHTPIYCSSTRVPHNWADGNGDALTFSFDSAFWVFNMVANFVYPRYSLVYPLVVDKIIETETGFFKDIAEVDAQAMKLLSNSTAAAVEYLTSYSETTANKLVQDWLVLWQQLFVMFRDGFVVKPQNVHPVPDHGGHQGGVVPDCQALGYANQSWYERIVRETGDHYQVTTSAPPTPDVKRAPIGYNQAKLGVM
jgi:dipeptidase